jgi:tryptophan halogenase
MSKLINKIVVVGGGSAGWMTAATLISRYPNKDITLIESPNIATVGVGESTVGGINNWMNLVGIKDKDFMPFTDASYKLSIQFTNFYRKDSGSFHYPFGFAYTEGNVTQKNDWYFKKIRFPETPVSDYATCMFPNMALVNTNKITKNELFEIPGFSFFRDTAYHFDATKFGLWLKDNFCLPKGVTHILADVKETPVNNDGIEHLVLSTGETVTADLFVDCTGFKSMLLGGALNEPFNSYEEMLPNNSAWATRVPYTDKEKQLLCYTDCEAIENGWVWNIPLWSRIGTGYVYSDKYVSDEDALEEFKNNLRKKGLYRDDLEYKNIKMRVGIHNRLWVKNVCAIGLSAGFIEPLESNGLYTVHEFLLRLVRTLDRNGYINNWDRDTFSSSCIKLFDSFAQFVALHYALSHRDDTPYWRDVGNRKFSSQLIDQDYTPFTDLFVDTMGDKMINCGEQGPVGGIHCIMAGLNWFLTDRHMVDAFNYGNETKDAHFEQVAKRLTSRAEHWARVIEDKPSLYEFLKTHHYSEANSKDE